MILLHNNQKARLTSLAFFFLFTLTSVRNIFKKFNLELIDFQKQVTHGGSMRYILKKSQTYECGFFLSIHFVTTGPGSS